MRAVKRKRTLSHNNQTRGAKSKAKKARLDARAESESDGEDFVTPAVGIPGVIEKLGLTNQNRPAGLVSFHLKTGKKHLGMFIEEESVANGYSLKTMREYSSDAALRFPFEVGQAVDVVGHRRSSTRRHDVTHAARVATRPPFLPEGSGVALDVPCLDGGEFVGTVRAFQGRTGVASFAPGDGRSALTHFALRDVTVGGLRVPAATYPHVVYAGMRIPLRIATTSADVPGVHYTADARLDVPACPPVGDAAGMAGEARGVIVVVADDATWVISCACADDAAERFFVVCQNVPTDCGPSSESDLHFGEGTRVLCSLNFLHDYGEVAAGGVYRASVRLPLKRGKIVELMDVDGCAYPRKVTVEIDREKRPVVIARKDLRVNGRAPGTTFPPNFFKLDMAVHLNDVWRANALETHATLDVSTNVLIRRNAVGEAERRAATETDLPTPAEENGPRKAPPLDGVVTAVLRNQDGLVLPSEADAVVGKFGHKVIIPSAKVMVNSKNRYLPPSYLSVGDPVKLYNVKFCKDREAYVAEINYFFPKNELKKACDEHKQNQVQLTL